MYSPHKTLIEILKRIRGLLSPRPYILNITVNGTSDNLKNQVFKYFSNSIESGLLNITETDTSKLLPFTLDYEGTILINNETEIITVEIGIYNQITTIFSINGEQFKNILVEFVKQDGKTKIRDSYVLYFSMSGFGLVW